MSARLDMLAALRATVDNPRGKAAFTLKRLGEYLAALGWKVTIEQRTEYGAGLKTGRVYFREPGAYLFTYFRAEKAGKVIERAHRYTPLYSVAGEVLQAIAPLSQIGA